MKSEVILQYEADLQRLIDTQLTSSGVKISYDDVARAALQKGAFRGKKSAPEVRVKKEAQCFHNVKDDTNS
ncbi:hypothetical protein [Pseudomonas coronafaciens]|uniref:hypothetical protein n=1 Tax=Pseudomonas coronafaciens TaxID=53409 RepID=UPI000EFE3F49|nr:hypothetical protein [Pseudomonas coronafaciens]